MSEQIKRKCEYCGKELERGEATKDHIIPRSMGGSSSPENLIIACRQCNMNKAAKTLRTYLIETIQSNTEYHNTFISSMESIKILIKNNAYEESVKQVFYRLLYSNIVASMETYLSDAFINTVMADNLLIRRLIESDPEFRNRKTKISEIYIYLDKLEQEVKEYLLEVIYHNIWKVHNMYKSTLNIDFLEDMENINSMIMIRHDIVHRNGKNKDTGETHNFTEEVILKCVDEMTEFINYIDSQLKILDSNVISAKVKKGYLDTNM